MHQLSGVNIWSKIRSCYSMDETWEDVLKDLSEDSNLIFGKADTVDVCLTSWRHRFMGWKLFIRTWKNKYLWLLPLIKLLNMSNSSLTNFKCKKKKKSLPTYPPADSVGRQCQTNNILRVALSQLYLVMLAAGTLICCKELWQPEQD